MPDETLGYAVFIGDLSRVRQLLANGADPDQPWGTGTPLLEVVNEPPEFFDEDAFRIAEALLDARADANAADADGLRPLHLATLAGPKALALLISRGANPNVQTLSSGASPLHYAVDYENPECVELLLQSGADPTIVDNDGETALDRAQRASAAQPSDELAHIIRLLRVVDPVEKPVFVLDGSRFADLGGFARELSHLIPEDTWEGNLNAFNDVLSGGYGTPDGGFVLRWLHSDQSRTALGYHATAKWLMSLIEARQGDREWLTSRMDDALNRRGPTLFDTLVEIIQRHGPDGRQPDSDIDLELS